MAKLMFNAFTGKFDYVGMTEEEVAAYLKLDQTTIQHVINGSPQFDEGITIKKDKKLVLDGD